MAVYDVEGTVEGAVVETDDGKGEDIFNYPNAFGFNTILRYTNTSFGMKEDIILLENTGINRFAFLIDTNGGLPILSGDATMINIVDPEDQKTILYTLQPLYAVDAHAQFGGDSQHDHYTEECYYELEELGDSRYKVTAVVDKSWLDHPQTVYPVTIDPTVNVNNTYSKVEDSHVAEEDPDGNYVTAPYLRIGNRNGQSWYSYLRFTELPTIPDGYRLSAATLKLTMREGQTSASRVSVLRVDSPWDSYTVTWNNRPSAPLPEAYQDYTNNYSAYYFDVASQVHPWYYQGKENYGFLIRYSNALVDDYNSFYSSDCGDASLAPALTITYSKSPATSTAVSDGVYYIRNKRSGKYLNVLTTDAEGMEALQNVTQYDFHGRANQMWRLVRQDNGYYKIMAGNTDLALDVDGAKMGAYTNIHLYTEMDSDGQQWLIEKNDDGTYSFASKCSQNTMYMAVDRTGIYENHANVFQYPHNETSDWYLEPLEDEAPQFIYISNKPDTDSLCIGDSYFLKATVTPSSANQMIIWESDNESIATVDHKGKVVAIAPGMVTIRARSMTHPQRYTEYALKIGYPFGAVKYKDVLYPIYVPDHLKEGPLEPEQWTTIYEFPRSASEFDLLQFITGTEFEDSILGNNAVYPGNRMDLPAIQSSSTSLPLGIGSILVGVLNSAQASIDSYFINFTFQTSDLGNRRVILSAGSSKDAQLLEKFADGYPRKALVENSGNVLKQVAINSAVREMYEEITGEDADPRLLQ